MKKLKKKILLEVGPGMSPVAFQHRHVERVLLDNDPLSIRRIRKVYDKRGEHLIFGDINKLPIKSGKITRLEARMVPQLYSWIYRAVQKDVEELARVTKKGGIVSITAEEPYPAFLKQFFQKVGFRSGRGCSRLHTHTEMPKKSFWIEAGFHLGLQKEFTAARKPTMSRPT